MGNEIVKKITELGFNFQGEGDPNKDRLIKTYKNYKEEAAELEKKTGVKIDVFDFITDMATDENHEFCKLLGTMKKIWPPEEPGLFTPLIPGQDAFFDSLNEDQAILISEKLEQYLPHFSKESV